MTDLPIGAVNLDPSAFIAKAVVDDMSATQALRMFREAGMTMRTQTFYQVYGEVRQAVGGRDALQGLDYTQPPPPESYASWQAGAEGRYATFVQTYVREPGAGAVAGELEPLDTRYFTYVSDSPHSPAEAIEAAQQHLIEGENANPAYGRIGQMFSVVTSIARTRGPR